MNSFRWSICVALAIVTLSCLASQPVRAQQEEEKKEPPSEGFNDTLRRMAIKRQEEEHKKLVKSSQQAVEIAEKLPDNIQGTNKDRLDLGAEKRLKEIEKAAKQIRSSIGGANDEKDFVAPKNLEEAVNRLIEASKTVSKRMEKTSRHITDATIIVSASDMLRLIKILREYIK